MYESFADIDPPQKADEIYSFLFKRPVYNEMKNTFGELGRIIGFPLSVESRGADDLPGNWSAGMMIDKKAFFNQMASAWDERFYTPELRKRLPQLVGLFHLQKGAKILDMGAGTGGIVPYLLEAIGAEGSIWAIDFAEEMVKIGRKKFLEENRVIFEVASVEDLPYKDGFFDQVVCFGAFPHFEDKAKALEEMARVLKPRGTLVIAHALSSTALRSHHQNCAPVSKDFLPEEGEMRELLERAGFQLKRLIDQPQWYLCEGLKT